MNYEPNAEGARWLAERVWPLVRRRQPDAQLLLVGADPGAALRRLAQRDASIQVTGTVPDVRPYLWRSAIAVAPLFTARGIQNKVLEAIAAGLPCVVSQPVWDGLPPGIGVASLLATSAEEFAAGIVRMLNLTPAERRSIAAQADLTSLEWTRCLAPLEPLLRRAAAIKRQPTPISWRPAI
jgi:glycosyltransferase involved in cell wall biosynthesis